MMQGDFDNFQTSDGVTLRMKIGLSVGKVEIHYIGNDKYKTFDVTGEAVDDVNQAQSLAKSGSVVISRAAWEMCNKPRCIAKIVGTGYAQVLHHGNSIGRTSRLGREGGGGGRTRYDCIREKFRPQPLFYGTTPILLLARVSWLYQ